MIKKFKQYFESVETDDLSLLKDQLSEDFPDSELKVLSQTKNSLQLEIDHCPIEPEEGSRVHRCTATVTVIKSGDSYDVSISGISGQYGGDESDGDIETEFDWEVGSSDIKVKSNFIDISKVRKFIRKELEEYLQ